MVDFADPGCKAVDMPRANSPYIPEAAECLRCGMCVSGCPTFRLFQTDEETPRRRIRIISKILVEKQTLSADERFHLDNCLQCRACAIACPSRMAYGRLFDQARTALQIKPKGWAKLALWLIAAKRGRHRLMPALAWYAKSGLRKPLQQSGLLKKLGVADAEALLTIPATPPLAENYPASRQTQGRVALFTGCLAEHFDRPTLSAAIKLLNAIGYEVQIPGEQGCCGAIHQHNGQNAGALIAQNINVFTATGFDAVLHTATGCGAMLSEYPGDGEAATIFRARIADINDFLLAHWPDELQLRPQAMKVALHEPCSQRNVLKNTASVYGLLAKIPGLVVSPLASNPLCCGAGGSYLLTHPDNASRLRDMKRQAIAEVGADIVVSSNYGCAAFISDPETNIIHPLNLLAKQLPTASSQH